MNADRALERMISTDSGRDRIMEIIYFLLSEIKENTPLTEIDLKPLSVRGFSETEISTAFSWLIDKFAEGPVENPVVLSVPFGKRNMLDPAKSGEEASFRIYHDAERMVITAEARGFLSQMLELGLISDAEQEFVIDRIMLAGTPTATLEDVKELVANLLFHFEHPSSPAGRVMLNGSDRVH